MEATLKKIVRILTNPTKGLLKKTLRSIRVKLGSFQFINMYNFICKKIIRFPFLYYNNYGLFYYHVIF